MSKASFAERQEATPAHTADTGAGEMGAVGRGGDGQRRCGSWGQGGYYHKIKQPD